MKIIALILSMVIFTSSLDATSFVSSLAMVSFSNVAETVPAHKGKCCKANVEKEVEEGHCNMDDESQSLHHDKKCCDGEGCKCKCCGHIVFVQPAMNLLRFMSTPFSERIPFTFNYIHDFNTNQFIPPNRS